MNTKLSTTIHPAAVNSYDS